MLRTNIEKKVPKITFWQSLKETLTYVMSSCFVYGYIPSLIFVHLFLFRVFIDLFT